MSIWLVASWLLVATVAVRAAMIEIYPYLREGDSADLAVLVDEKSLCTIRIENAAQDVSKKSACRFELPAAAATLSVRGEYRGVHWDTKQRYSRKGEQSWPLVDFAGVGGRLIQPGKPYGERMADFIAAANRFATERLGKEYGQRIRARRPAAQADIDAARKRLGYGLPADFLSMQQKVGAIVIGDHGLTEIEQVADADTQMRTVWGTPAEAMKEAYSEQSRANLRASTLLFTEVGDGYGGLRYRPPPNKTCGDQPYYQWISQEGSDKALKHADGRCMDFAAAFRWVLEGFLLEDYADELASEKQALLIDSSAAVQPLVLQTGTDRFAIGLVVRWQGPNGRWRAVE